MRVVHVERSPGDSILGLALPPIHAASLVETLRDRFPSKVSDETKSLFFKNEQIAREQSRKLVQESRRAAALTEQALPSRGPRNPEAIESATNALSEFANRIQAATDGLASLEEIEELVIRENSDNEDEDEEYFAGRRNKRLNQQKTVIPASPVAITRVLPSRAKKSRQAVIDSDSDSDDMSN
jgi:hypothetical protein